MSDLGNVLDLLDVSGIAACAEDDAQSGAWIDVMRCHERTGSVVYASGYLNRDLLQNGKSSWTTQPGSSLFDFRCEMK